MKKIIILSLFLIGSACQREKPETYVEWAKQKIAKYQKDRDSKQNCVYNFAIQMYDNADLQECDKEDLIQDIEDYIDYFMELEKMGELYREIFVRSVPNSLIRTERVFCFDQCNATIYFQEKCFHWEHMLRKTINDHRIRAEKERKKYPECATKWKNLRKETERYDYNWRNTPKYKEWKSGKCGQHIPCKF